MPVVAYREYRAYERQRIETNNAMMGLLAGSKLASQLLVLTDGASRPLSEIFPSIEHIERFNLRSDLARSVLDDAEDLLGILPVPQVLALHEHLFRSMLEVAAPGNSRLLDNLGTSNIHERFAETVSAVFPSEALELFHYLRVARNSHIHTGGFTTKSLATRSAGLSRDAEALWNTVAGSPLRRYQVGDRVRIGISELTGALALTKRLAEVANVGLQGFLSRDQWADLLVEDWASEVRQGDITQKLRSLKGFAKMHGYRELSLTQEVLRSALERHLA
ncbi:hypothetical protein [Leifsonia sp. C5G2]|uniref:hypothetical protein n=1 Tax=Leifsonia sp. C5G2 TaxID=2735269 RepID=UPI00158540F4|nr:hypothetical protein [Leifsonia sp. C5G2]NUU06772.1 hypothetical protein [Leifsonia sp. C5G2]